MLKTDEGLTPETLECYSIQKQNNNSILKQRNNGALYWQTTSVLTIFLDISKISSVIRINGVPINVITMSNEFKKFGTTIIENKG